MGYDDDGCLGYSSRTSLKAAFAGNAGSSLGPADDVTWVTGKVLSTTCRHAAHLRNVLAKTMIKN